MIYVLYFLSFIGVLSIIGFYCSPGSSSSSEDVGDADSERFNSLDLDAPIPVTSTYKILCEVYPNRKLPECVKAKIQPYDDLKYIACLTGDSYKPIPWRNLVYYSYWRGFLLRHNDPRCNASISLELSLDEYNDLIRFSYHPHIKKAMAV